MMGRTTEFLRLIHFTRRTLLQLVAALEEGFRVARCRGALAPANGLRLVGSINAIFGAKQKGWQTD